MLQKLKEYKEMLAIIVFFLGGFFWLESQFPTKSDLKAEVASLDCLLEKYMGLTQLQIRLQQLDKEIPDLKSVLSDRLPEGNGAGSSNLSPAMKLEFDQMKVELEHKAETRRDLVSKMEAIRDELGRDVCRKASL